MSSPNEPGYPRAGDTPGGANGSVGGHTADSGDVPPWQRGPAARAARQPQRQSSEPHTAAGHPPGVDARLNRFIAGGSGSSAAPPAHDQDVPGRGDRTEAVRPEAYPSELPDLSGPRAPQQRKPAPERTPPEPASRPSQPASRIQVGTKHKGPVRATMQIRRVDPWSALKVSLVLSGALFFVWMIAVAFLYLVLGGMGVWSKLNSNVGDLLTSASGQTGGELVSSGTIFGGAALIGLVNIVLLTAMATVGAFIYNLTTDLVGGVEVTLADRD
ncbi:DUF3566 domain-containing protein [Mycolicibacterium moriokaense]|uniref:Transmembrane protein DUF3566 n=1 Tax=Mycolicibacterium moriokaense TaxID=39691 RepID=A0A318HR16_9MYCO|nr:DUF3566 domain-containing protein [Mycolicibacterium moriokaense]PXX12886.1 transmembrane protein DUF3566 [Mycolicibacterium moriokaense]